MPNQKDFKRDLAIQVLRALKDLGLTMAEIDVNKVAPAAEEAFVAAGVMTTATYEECLEAAYKAAKKAAKPEADPESTDGDYPNPKVNALLNHVGDFEPRDFLDAALAMLDQADVRSATYNRAVAAVKALIDEETPEPEVDAESPTPAGSRIIARFHPQAWINDTAIECDAEGEIDWDITADILALPREEALAIEDDDDSKAHSSDHLRTLPSAPRWIREWQGPYWVEVEESIRAYFGETPEQDPEVAVLAL